MDYLMALWFTIEDHPIISIIVLMIFLGSGLWKLVVGIIILWICIKLFFKWGDHKTNQKIVEFRENRSAKRAQQINLRREKQVESRKKFESLLPTNQGPCHYIRILLSDEDIN